MIAGEGQIKSLYVVPSSDGRFVGTNRPHKCGTTYKALTPRLAERSRSEETDGIEEKCPKPVRFSASVLIALLAGLLPVIPAFALIDPTFTPIHLVRQSDTVRTYRVIATAQPDVWQLSPLTVIKGGRAGDSTLDLAACDATYRPDIQALLKQNGSDPVLLFTSRTDKGERGFLHVNGNWLRLVSPQPKRWDCENFDLKMSGTFAGGTPNLIATASYIQAYPDATVPVAAGTSWAGGAAIGQVDGACHGLAIVERPADGAPCIFVASEKGDRLFCPRKGKDFGFDDVTQAAGLDSRSRAFAWVDLNRDGRPDLVNWDGEILSVRWQEDGFKFRAGGSGSAWKMAGPCQGIDVAGATAAGAQRIVLSTASAPVVLSYTAEGSVHWNPVALPVGRNAAGADGASRCIVADLDNDGYADILQPRVGAGLLWRGTPQGFSDPTTTPLTGAGAATRFALGDFNADGFLDIFVSLPDRNQLWQNDGHGAFRDVTAGAGSLAYKSPAGASVCLANDLNHDGRTDLLLAYRDGDCIYHFNRGYGCMGETGELHLSDIAGIAPGTVGIQAGLVGDFNRDGADDLVVCLTDGRLLCAPNNLADMPGIAARLDRRLAGPVTVSVWQGAEPNRYSVGTYSLIGNGPPRFLGLRQPGECVLQWRLPGRDAASVTRTVHVGSEGFVIAP